MESMLKKHDNINVVYCENDNEAFGAIDAIEAAGKKVGPDGDILVMSFEMCIRDSDGSDHQKKKKIPEVEMKKKKKHNNICN